MAASADPAPAQRRAVCAHCCRPTSVCYCAALTTLETRSRVVILQHPRERGKAIGTAHMATLCLPEASLHVGTAWDDSQVMREACGDPARPPILLYPGPDARDILREPPPGPVTLLVVDGTWSQARSMVRQNPRLAAIPRYAFRAPEPSTYRIRRQPRPQYVSTLEALMHVLGALEGEPERFRALLAPMKTMVDAQVAAKAKRAQPRRVRRAPRSLRERLPRELLERQQDLVLVAADANAWPFGTPQRAHGDELVRLVAHRPSTAETFSFIVAPRKPLAPDVARQIELDTDLLRAGGSAADMLAAFAAFTRPTDVFCSWGYHSLRLLKDAGGKLPETCLDLRRTARALANAKVKTIEAYAADLGIAPCPALAQGRAGRRLGLLAAVLNAWYVRTRSA